LGLGGELRGGKGIEARISEAIKLGFKRIVLPKSSGVITKKYGDQALLYPCSTLKEALSVGLTLGREGIDGLILNINKKKKTNKQNIKSIENDIFLDYDSSNDLDATRDEDEE
jgi:hypothetical protein